VDAREEGSGVVSDDAAHRAFERGDFAEARKLALAMKASGDEAARQAADLLLAKMGLDPLINAITAACIGLFAAIAIFAR
jgi:hypothetical protein